MTSETTVASRELGAPTVFSGPAGCAAFSRAWAMPSAETFSIPPIADMVRHYLRTSTVSVDPFARNRRWAQWTNDLDPSTAAEYHMEAEDFLRMLVEKGVRPDLVILDPPYSPRQVKECYDGIGIKMAKEDAMGGATRKRRRELIMRMVDPGAVVLTCGWNTNGMGPGWTIERILLVAHGSDHNDTICMAERLTALQTTMFDGHNTAVSQCAESAEARNPSRKPSS